MRASRVLIARKIRDILWPTLFSKVGKKAHFAHFYFELNKKSLNKSGLVAKKSGQMAIFFDKSGQKKSAKKVQNSAKKVQNRPFLGAFCTFFERKLVLWPKAHFCFLILYKIKIFNIIYK